MRNSSKHTYRLMCLILVLTGLMIGAILAPEPVERVAAQAVGPRWSLTGNFNTPRLGHTATLLPNGKVLVTGGFNCGAEILNSTELYDPATGAWSYSGSLSDSLYEHTATLLPNGKVLVAGGDWGAGQISSVAELYDPATGRWSPTGGLNFPRGNHTATLLANGNVLVVGPWETAEIYDPATGRWRVTGSLNTTKYGYHATLLPNGKVLFVGGTGNSSSNSDTAELYDPDTGTWQITGSPKTIREPYNIILLPSGRVLLIGLVPFPSPNPGLRAELYDPANGVWSSTSAPSNGGTPILLPNGKVLAASLNTAELYDPATGRWSFTTQPNTQINNNVNAFLLSNGQFLFPNGLVANGPACAPDSAKPVLFDVGLSQPGTVSSVSAASFSLMRLAGEAITAGFGTGLATTTSGASMLPLPTSLAGTTVMVKDSADSERLAPLFFVSPTQVNYQIPAETAAGLATVTIASGNGTVSTGVAIVHAVAPSLFAANGNGQGVAAALALRVKADGSQSYEPIVQFDTAQNKFIVRPLDLGSEGEQVYLLLFGTGIRQRRSLSSVIASIGGTYAEVSFAGAQPDSVGLDQVNVLVPRSLAGRGEVEILLTVEAKMANPVRIIVK